MNKQSHTTIDILNAAKEASSWCQLNWDSLKPRSSLRSLNLLPNLFEDDHYHSVNQLISSRKYEIKKLGLNLDDQFLNQGKILIYEPDSNIADCMSEQETNGYFDSYDCPPWDTWIGYILINEDKRYVLSWVLNEVVPIVETGFEVNPVDCIYWLESSHESFALELRKVFTKY